MTSSTVINPSFSVRKFLRTLLSPVRAKLFKHRKYLGLSEQLYNYIQSVSLREAEPLTQLRQETSQLPMGAMQVIPEEGQFIALLIHLIAAKKTLEIGVFTGYSTLATALALPPDGKVIACDVSEDYTAIARRYWKKAGVDHKIDLRLAPALDTIDRLLAEGNAGTFDFVFIDADKESYDAYYERSLQLLRPNGLIMIDNVLWGGNVARSDRQDEVTNTIRALNKKIYRDPRVAISLLPLGDGITLVTKF